MEGVIKDHTFWFSVPLYWLPVIALGSEPLETVKAFPEFVLMIACGPEPKDIVVLDMGMGEIGTWGTLYSPRDGRADAVPLNHVSGVRVLKFSIPD